MDISGTVSCHSKQMSGASSQDKLFLKLVMAQPSVPNSSTNRNREGLETFTTKNSWIPALDEYIYCNKSKTICIFSTAWIVEFLWLLWTLEYNPFFNLQFPRFQIVIESIGRIVESKSMTRRYSLTKADSITEKFRTLHRSSVNSPHKVQWREALMFSLICAWINGWVNNR